MATSFAMSLDSPAATENWSLPDGRTLHLRPVRPEDAPKFREGFRRLTREEVISRFFAPLKSIDHMMDRLTQPDMESHIAFVLVDDESRNDWDIVGVSRLVKDTDGVAAEFAVIIDKSLYGIRLGERLIRHLGQHACHLRVPEMHGYVARDNHRMAKLCLRLGFDRKGVPSDPTILRLSIDPVSLADSPARQPCS